MVSPIHCALLQTPAGLWVVDLLGRQGIAVNGTAVRWARLEDADELRIGPFLIRVQVLRGPNGADSAAPSSSPVRHGFPTTSQREGQQGVKESVETRNAVLPPLPSLVPSTLAAGTLPADLEGMLSAPPVVSIPCGVASTVGGAVEALLLPMMRQFSLMQQQMFDQFQQALLRMVQMFSGLHREQLQLIRQELNQLSELTRELQSLQAEPARQASIPARMEADALPRAESVPLPPPAAPAVSPSAKVTPSQAPPPHPRQPAEKLPTSAAEDSGRSPREVHGWLMQRLASLQQERQSRWQKILNVLTGK